MIPKKLAVLEVALMLALISSGALAAARIEAFKAKVVSVSQTLSHSSFPSVAVDNSGNPFVSWVESTASGAWICLLRKSSGAWLNISGEPANSSNSRLFECKTSDAWPKVRIAPDGNPAICWRQTEGASHYARWDGVLWRNVRGEVYSYANGSLNNGSFDILATEFVFGSDGLPSIMSYNKFLRFDGSKWVTVRNQPFTGNNDEMHAMNGYQVAFALDSLDKPHVCWTSFYASKDVEGNPFTATRISYARWTGENWVNMAGLALEGSNGQMDTATESMHIAIALDSRDRPTVIYSLASQGYESFDLFMQKGADGAWSGRQAIPHPQKSSSVRPEIVVDASDQTHLAWVEYSHNSSSTLNVYYIFTRNGGWVTPESTRYRGIDGVASFEYDGDGSLLPRMAIDNRGDAHIVWHDRAMSPSGFKPAEVLYAMVESSSVQTVRTRIEFTVNSVKVTIDGNPETLVGAPYIFNGSTMVPFRYLGEAIGAKVGFTSDPKTRLVKGITYELNGRLIALEIGSLKAFAGDSVVMLNAPPQIKKGKTYVPLRFVTDALGGLVEWNARQRKATIIYPK